jgi:four helix bundle protein
MQRFTDLKVWQRAHELALNVYRLTREFPAEERFGLTGQIRRAVVSVPTNIAEGSKRRSPSEYARFLNVAEASLAETEYFLILIKDLAYASQKHLEPLFTEATEIGKMLHGLRCTVEKGR